MKLLIPVLVLFLSVELSIGLNGCDRQVPPTNAVKEPPHVPDTAVGGMARSAIDKAKGVERTLGEADNRTVPVKPSENLTEAGVVASFENLTGDSGASGCRFPPGLSLGRPGDRRS